MGLKKRGRPPKIKEPREPLGDISDREGFIAQLRSEADKSTSDIARIQALRLLGQALGHLERDPPKRAPSVPADPLLFARHRLGQVRRRMEVATATSYPQLVAVERDLLQSIAAEELRRKAAADKPDKMPLEDWQASLREKAARMAEKSPADLEIYAAAWLASKNITQESLLEFMRQRAG